MLSDYSGILNDGVLISLDLKQVENLAETWRVPFILKNIYTF